MNDRFCATSSPLPLKKVVQREYEEWQTLKKEKRKKGKKKENVENGFLQSRTSVALEFEFVVGIIDRSKEHPLRVHVTRY